MGFTTHSQPPAVPQALTRILLLARSLQVLVLLPTTILWSLQLAATSMLAKDIRDKQYALVAAGMHVPDEATELGFGGGQRYAGLTLEPYVAQFLMTRKGVVSYAFAYLISGAWLLASIAMTIKWLVFTLSPARRPSRESCCCRARSSYTVEFVSDLVLAVCWMGMLIVWAANFQGISRPSSTNIPGTILSALLLVLYLLSALYAYKAGKHASQATFSEQGQQPNPGHIFPNNVEMV